MHEQILRSLSLLSLLALPVMTAAAASAATPICSGVRIPIDTSVFSKPFANLALGGNEGDFLIDTGATYSQVDMRRYAVPNGIKTALSGFSLPLAESGVFTASDLILLCHKFRYLFRAAQHGHRDSIVASAATNLRRIVAIEL